MTLAERFEDAISRIGKDHDFAFTWEYDERKSRGGCGPNVFAGFPYAEGEAKALDRFEALVLAAEDMALKSENRDTGFQQ